MRARRGARAGRPRRRGSTTSRRSSPAASSSASRSRAPSPSGPTCCSATSRPARSTSRPACVVLEVLERVNRELGTTTARHHPQRRDRRHGRPRDPPAPTAASPTITRNARARRAARARAGEPMRALDRKLLRDLVAPARPGARDRAGGRLRRRDSSSMSRRTYRLAARTRGDATTRDYRFADVFAQLEARAASASRARLAAIPGVAAVRDARRRERDARRRRASPSRPPAGCVSLPDAAASRCSTTCTCGAAAASSRARDDEVLVSEAFADAQRPRARRPARRGHQRPLAARCASSASRSRPSTSTRSRRARSFPDNRALRRALDGPRARSAAAFDMEGAFNDVALRARAPAPTRATVIAARRPRCSRRYGGARRLRPRRTSSRTASSPTRSTQLADDRRRVFPAIFLGVAAFLLNVVLARLVALQREQIAVAQGVRLRDARDRRALPQAGAADRRCSASAVGRRRSAPGSAQALTDLYTRRSSASPYLRLRARRRASCGRRSRSAAAAAVARRAAARCAARSRLPPAEAMRPEPPPRYRADAARARSACSAGSPRRRA